MSPGSRGGGGGGRSRAGSGEGGSGRGRGRGNEAPGALGRDRRKGSPYRRPVATRTVKPRFLIVCEDGKTSPNYFDGFRVKSATVRTVGTGMNTHSLVREAVYLKALLKIDERRDQVWVVMDRDSFPRRNYARAFAEAEANGIRVAYCNECFELWYLLHFECPRHRIPRGRFAGLLSRALGFKYKKNLRGLYLHLRTRQRRAIANAKRLLRQHRRERGHTPPAHINPATSVHLLVQELNRFL